MQKIQPKTFDTVTHEATRQWIPLSFRTGKLAPHCDGAVEISMGNTTLLVTAVLNRHPDKDKTYMPLAIDFRESYYAAGKIGWGRFRKREGRPSDESVLYARLTDRPIRPMFPDGMVNDVIVTISPLSLDKVHSPGELSIIGASTAIMLAGIPFTGPVNGVRIGHIDGDFVVGLTDDKLEDSLFDLHVAGTADQINMLEAGGNEAPIDLIKQGLQIAQDNLKELAAIQQAFIDKANKAGMISQKEIHQNILTDEQYEELHAIATDEQFAKLEGVDKETYDTTYSSIVRHAQDQLAEQVADSDNHWTLSRIDIGVFALLKKYLRKRLLNDGVRIDGRDTDQIRQIFCEVDTVPLAHGTGLFWRGDTQVLSLLTLGSPGDAQLVDGMEDDGTEQRRMHHYKMPPFSNNEPMMIRFTNRREIGHGRLAEKAMEAVLPSQEDFPYTMRMVSEVLGSGGSTSMASVCGSTLALMAWWVPIKAPVSGIAMGLMCDDDQQIILTDIKGTEDFVWDMDFKLAGTTTGMTAIQMDTKLQGLGVTKLNEMIDKANEGREAILQYMLGIIDKPRDSVADSAPSLLKFKVKPEEVRSVIGPGGSVIQEIVRETGVKIDIEDDGAGVITGDNQLSAQKALDMIKAIVRKPTIGDTFEGKVTRTEKYGVFVDIGNGKTWLCHVKQMGRGFVEDASTIFNVGDNMKVELVGDDNGKYQLKCLTPTNDA